MVADESVGDDTGLAGSFDPRGGAGSGPGFDDYR